MFLIHRPSSEEIDRFLGAAKNLSLSYQPIGLAQSNPRDFKIDEAIAEIGQGESAFASAKAALKSWRHFELGWVQLFPCRAPIEPQTTVAVLARHLGLWSLNACRVVYSIDDATGGNFGFAYGTLTEHAECGEELFEVAFDRGSGQVSYRIRAVSKPRAALAKIGYPFTRLFQDRFRRDSIRAMKRAVAAA